MQLKLVDNFDVLDFSEVNTLFDLLKCLILEVADGIVEDDKEAALPSSY